MVLGFVCIVTPQPPRYLDLHRTGCYERKAGPLATIQSMDRRPRPLLFVSRPWAAQGSRIGEGQRSPERPLIYANSLSPLEVTMLHERPERCKGS